MNTRILEGPAGFFNLFPEEISGAEEDPAAPPAGTDPDPNAGSAGDPDPDAGSGNQDDSDKEGDKEPKEDVSGLKSALSKERRRAELAEKEAKRLKKAEEERELAAKSESERATIAAQKAEEKAAKAAQGLLKRDINDAIRCEAQKLNFIDPEDAVEGVGWDSIEYTQDDENPSDIKIDQKTVAAAVKALAAKKKHFLKSGTDDGEPTGGKFGGAGSKKTPDTEDELRKLYPSLG